MAEQVRSAVASLSADERRALARRLAARRKAPGAGGIAARSDGRRDFPLSSAQRRFWFLQQVQPTSSGFNVVETRRLRGAVDHAALQKSLDEILRRHAPLRTGFLLSDGVPVQRVYDAEEQPLPVEDCRGMPPEKAGQRLAARLTAPWDLERGPLLRAALARTADDEHQLYMAMHHIASDGWSQGVLGRELDALYAAYRAAGRSPLPELQVQYADYSIWQQEWLKSDGFRRQLRFWTDRMADAPTLHLPAHASAAADGFIGFHNRVLLPPALVGPLGALARQEGGTVFVAILAAFGSLLGRYSGQDDVVVGSPIANRTRTELEGMIGCFMNPLPLRLDLSGRPSFRELLKRAREMAFGAYAHQEVPFDEIVRAVHVNRQPSALPLYQAMLVLQNYERETPSLSRNQAGRTAGEEVDRAWRRDPLRKSNELLYPLTLELREFEGRLVGRFEYRREYAGVLDGAPGHLQRLLEGAVRDPDRPMVDHPLLTEAERRTILVDWNPTPPPVESGPWVHDAFRDRARRDPDATAVVCGERSVSYGALERRANGLARRLAAAGVRPGERVALLLERSPEMALAILGVMKAGAAYVPLDPSHPAERRCDVTRAAGARVVLRSAGSRVAAPEGAEVLDVAMDEAEEAEDPPRIRTGPSDVAYVLFTSGSTGVPKGVVISHGNLASACQAWEKAYGLRPADRHLQMASVAFDVCTGDLVRALCSGGCLVIAPQELLLDPPLLYDLMRRERVTCAEFVPAVLRGLIRHLEETSQGLEFMRLVIAGSDAWYVGDRAAAARVCGPETLLVNSYGLTEATVDSTWFSGDATGSPKDATVPIGRPYPNTRVYVLDPGGEPVPVGVAGELFVAGPAVGVGYLGRPDLTAERFVPDPFSPTPSARMYRTGDRALYLPDGSIEHLGRIDHQVKLRGFRVELGEVEAALFSAPGVREAAVIVHGAGSEPQRLVAYVVAAGGDVTAASLRAHLKRRLPEYMTPAAFEFVGALPLSSNGKIDRSALPAPTFERQVEAEFVPPRTEAQRAIAAIWQEILEVDQVGLHDNFFDLGGYSLLLMQARAKLNERFEGDLSMIEMFEHTTVGTLARRLSREAEEVPAPAAGDGRDSERQAGKERLQARLARRKGSAA